MIISVAGIAAMLMMLAGIASLFSCRTRPVGLVILGLAAIGMVFMRATIRHSHRAPNAPSPPRETMAPFDPFQHDANSAAPLFHVQPDGSDVAAEESVESLWTNLTRPKINLELPDAPSASANQDELAEAVKVILSASAPGADPFTQGWLLNAAKAIISAAPKAGDANDSSTVAVATAAAADPYAEPIAQYEGQYKAVAAAAAAEAAAAEPDKPKPDWVVNPPKPVGNTHPVVVSTDPYSTAEECQLALQEKLSFVVQRRIDDLARAADGGSFTDSPGLESMGITIPYIYSELCPEPEDYYIETVNASFGEMKRAHALVEFNEAQDRVLLQRWRDYARVESLMVVGGILSLAVAGLAFAYGLLQVDTWTRGYYSKRLFLGVPAAIIAVVFLLSTL